MPAKNGAPVYTVPSLVEGGQEWEVQEPESTTLLAVCPDCGFEFCASHMVEDDAKRRGFECHRCLIRLFIEARAKAIEDATVLAVAKQQAAILAELHNLRGEVEHLRPQNTLLREESVALRYAAKTTIELLYDPIRERADELGAMQELIKALGDES